MDAPVILKTQGVIRQHLTISSGSDTFPVGMKVVGGASVTVAQVDLIPSFG